MGGSAGGEGKLDSGKALPDAGWAHGDRAEESSFSALPVLEAFLTPVKNLSNLISTSLCGLFTGAYFWQKSRNISSIFCIYSPRSRIVDARDLFSLKHCTVDLRINGIPPWYIISYKMLYSCATLVFCHPFHNTFYNLIWGLCPWRQTISSKSMI